MQVLHVLFLTRHSLILGSVNSSLTASLHHNPRIHILYTKYYAISIHPSIHSLHFSHKRHASNHQLTRVYNPLLSPINPPSSHPQDQTTPSTNPTKKRTSNTYSQPPNQTSPDHPSAPDSQSYPHSANSGTESARGFAA